MLAKLTYAELLDHAGSDPAVVGLVLKGSHAHDGMATEYSDRDVYVVVAEGAQSRLSDLDGHRSVELDAIVITLDRFRALDGHERYALSRAQVVIDRLDGEITEIIAAKAVSMCIRDRARRLRQLPLPLHQERPRRQPTRRPPRRVRQPGLPAGVPVRPGPSP